MQDIKNSVRQFLLDNFVMGANAKIADDVEADFVEIPPMLIQPYIENAIWHGLMQKETGGKIVIDCRQKEDKYLVISILALKGFKLLDFVPWLWDTSPLTEFVLIC